MANHLEVGVADPVANGGLGASEEVVDDCDFMTKDHETIDEMRSNESSASCDKDALALRGGKQLDGRETREGGIRDRVCLWVIDRL